MLLTHIQENQLKWIAVKQVRHSLDKCEKTQRTRNGNGFSMLTTSKSLTISVCAKPADGLKPNRIPGPEWKSQENEHCLLIKIENTELLPLAVNKIWKQTGFLQCFLFHLKGPVCLSIISHKAWRQVCSFLFLLGPPQFHPLFLFPLPVRLLREDMCSSDNPNQSSFSLRFVYVCYFFQHASYFFCQIALTKALLRE